MVGMFLHSGLTPQNVPFLAVRGSTEQGHELRSEVPTKKWL